MNPPEDEYKYYSAQNPSGHGGEQLARAVLAAAAGLGDRVRTVCDLGCGNGYLAGLLSQAGYRVVGVDASPSGIAIAEHQYPKIRFVAARFGRDLGKQIGGPFDLVVSSEVIEHLYRPSDLLEAADALLSPEGALVITTPYHGYWKNLALAVSGRMERHFDPLADSGHIKFFGVRSLTRLLATHGFKVLQFSFIGRLRPFAKSMLCVAHRAQGPS